MRPLAICLAAVAAALLPGGRPDLLSMRLGIRRSSDTGLSNPNSRRALPGSRLVWALLGGTIGAAAGGLAAPPGGAVIGGLVTPVVVLSWFRRRSRLQRRGRESAVSDACLALASELQAGLPPERAMAAVAQEWPDLFGSAAGRAAIGGDPAQALRVAATEPGAEPLTAVAAAWEVSARTGASLSAALTAVTDSLRAEAAVRREADAQLAAVRSTARLLAMLPAATLLLFSAGNGAPLDFLLRTPHGMACIIGALVFVAAGLCWVEYTSRLSVRTPWSS
ncbi:type II secretion system F family protein [Phytoactinopolyspora endophytica]|uniref:type II secretion system F family protein n=1 Tax=Phytoactinopolyspora endophytica TaxID=1642495 RepID=UPI00101E1EDC|nr:type II secretion system F family protein [Phytoactinopolyspora endophytica]